MKLPERNIPAGAIMMLALGVVLVAGFGYRIAYWQQQLLWVGAAVALAVLPFTRDAIARGLERIRHPSPSKRAVASVVIAIVATLYLLETGLYQHRDWIPKFHDEHMYLIQMQMLARGHLWLAQHPLADFFETTHVLVKPVYAPIYFPGTALMELPTVWLKMPFWLMPAILSGIAVGLMYRVATELTDGVGGALAALLLVSLTQFRYLSLIVMSHTNTIVLGLAVVWAWLCWRQRKQIGWLIVLGVLSGWAAITRPIDAVAFVFPVGVALLWDTRGVPLVKRFGLLAIPVVAGAPFLILQVAFNMGVNGSPLKTPYARYLEEFSPQQFWGFPEFDPRVRPKTQLLQKQDYYDLFTVPELLKHRRDKIVNTWLTNRFPLIAKITLPSTLLLVLLPLGIASARRAGQRIFIGWILIYIALYAVFTYLLAHYVTVIAPPMIGLVVLGLHSLERLLRVRWPRSGTARALPALAAAALALPSFAELNPRVKDDIYKLPVMEFNYKALPELVKKPAIVMFTYERGCSIHEEPVYNIDVANPDDAPIIRMHNLGAARDWDMVRYYATRQPGRHVYGFNRRTGQLSYIGTIAELAKIAPPAPASEPAK